MDTIGAQLWLLAYDVRRGGPRGGRQAGYAVVAGLLAELLTRRRLAARGRRCEVADPAPTGYAVSDRLLTRIAGAPARPWEDWIREYGRAALAAVVADLEDRCRVVPYERRIARVVALRRHALVDPAGTDRLRSAVRGALLAGGEATVEPRLAIVASLAVTAGIGDLMTTAERNDLDGRADRLGAAIAPVRRSLDTVVRSLSVELSLGRMPATI